MIKLKEMPVNNLPRERLLKDGKESLADYEVLAIILRTGIKGKNVLDLSKEMLTKFQLNEFSNLTINELMEIKGIKEAKAIEILAAIEFGKRVSNYISVRTIIKNNKEAYLYLKNKMEDLEEEHLICLYLNIKSEVVYEKTISIGSINDTSFDINKIIKYALKNSSNHIIISHNHPTGDPLPSNNDIIITHKAIDLLNKFDIKLIDHIIIGKNKYYSFNKQKIVYYKN